METTHLIEKIWFDGDKIFMRTTDGKEQWQSLLWYHRLFYASESQRANYYITTSGIHWPNVDEDISIESFFYNDPEPVGIAKIFRQYPELNVAAFARRLGMKQSLLAAYVSGIKKPSAARTKEIENAIYNFADEIKRLKIKTKVLDMDKQIPDAPDPTTG